MNSHCNYQRGFQSNYKRRLQKFVKQIPKGTAEGISEKTSKEIAEGNAYSTSEKNREETVLGIRFQGFAGKC